MMTMLFRVVYRDTNVTEVVRVTARSINTGFAKALTEARDPLGNGQEREIESITLRQVMS